MGQRNVIKPQWWMVVGIVAMCAVPVCSAQTSEMELMTAASQTSEADAKTSFAVLQVTSFELDEDDTPLRISMNLQDALLKDVLKIFSEQSRLNLIASKDVENQLVTLYLDKVDVLDALDQILRANDLVSEKLAGSEIYIIKARPEAGEVALELLTRIYKLKYARVANSVLGQATNRLLKGLAPFEAVAARSVGEQGAATSSGFGGSRNIESGGIDAVIQRLLTEHGHLVTDERTNSLIVTDITDNFPRLEAAITKLDVRTPQVLIEVELIETTLTKAKDLGIEFGIGSDGTLATFTPAMKSTTFPFTNDQGKNVLTAAATNAALGTIDTADFQMVLKALETDKETRILARPKILTMDNESAVIRLVEETAIAITSVEVSQSGNVSTTVERSDTGIILSVTPQVNVDGYVTMLVEPSVNKPVASSLQSQSQSILNPKERSIRSLVRLREGTTLVMGGMIDRKEEESIRKVPLLGDIPFLGALFKKQDVDVTDTELLVFITPHVIRDDEQALVATANQALLAFREQEQGTSRVVTIEDELSGWERRRRYRRK